VGDSVVAGAVVVGDSVVAGAVVVGGEVTVVVVVTDADDVAGGGGVGCWSGEACCADATDAIDREAKTAAYAVTREADFITSSFCECPRHRWAT